MVMNPSSSFRRYTPPTCTLEMYNPQPFWGKWRYQSFPEYFSFQLHFDDPRVPQSDRTSIVGDRTLLEKLREKVDKYVREYLHNEDIVRENLSCELPPSGEAEFICLSQESPYNHCLYYLSWQSQGEKIKITLSNTQLLDLVNALEAYSFDVKKSKEKNYKTRGSNLGLSIAITGLIAFVGGGLWWRYEDKMVSQQGEITPSENNDSIPLNNIEKVVPPSSLDPNTLPKEVFPEVPEELARRQSLVPPIERITPPQMPVINPETTFPEENHNHNFASVLLPPPTDSSTSIAFEINPVNNSQNSSNLLIPPPPSNPQTNNTNPSFSPNPSPPPFTPSRLSTLPTLSSSSITDDIPNSLTDNIPSNSVTKNENLDDIQAMALNQTQQFTTGSDRIRMIDSSSLTARSLPTNTISQEIQKYFQEKWQPPQNLGQSIEYRLKLNGSGNLTRITPIGQTAMVFLDQTKMPLLGERLISSMPDDLELSSVTIRLILSPNGNVQAFQESIDREKS